MTSLYPAKSKTENIFRKIVLLEFNKNINIQTYKTWRKKYYGETKTKLLGTYFQVKKPTMELNGFKVFYAHIKNNDEVCKWNNRDIVIYFLSKHNINKSFEVVYDMKSFNNNKDFHIFYKPKVTNT